MPVNPIPELVEKWKSAQNGSERDSIQQELRGRAKEQFTATFDAHEKEIEQLESQVKRLREHLELRHKKQDEIVDFRVQQLLRDAQGLGWGTGTARPAAIGPSMRRGGAATPPTNGYAAPLTIPPVGGAYTPAPDEPVTVVPVTPSQDASVVQPMPDKPVQDKTGR